MYLPESVLTCIRILEQAGYRAYAVGGCVRDSLLGNIPHDYDLCTNASPDTMCRLFSAYTLVRSGEKHGTIGVVIDKEVYEITTFRTEGGYQDSRHPDWVRFVSTVEEDLSRRDFTVNAMAYNPQTGYIDPWGGQQDLSRGILRAVGDPATRFTEDPLRILRGVRFAVRYGLTPDPNTQQAMFRLASLMDKLARERVFDELCKLLPLVTAADLLRFSPIITQVIPELAPSVGFWQHNPHHAYDVFTHTAHVVEGVSPVPALRWAALLHDVAKPRVFTMDDRGIGHFLDHGPQGGILADQILLRLKAPTALRQQVVFLVSHHMTPLEPDKKLLRRRLGRYGEENTRLLLELQKADFGHKGTGEETTLFCRIEETLAQILAEDPCLSIRDLAVDGHDLRALGMESGPQMGACLHHLLNCVQAETHPNEKDALLAEAKAFCAAYKQEETL